MEAAASPNSLSSHNLLQACMEACRCLAHKLWSPGTLSRQADNEAKPADFPRRSSQWQGPGLCRANCDSALAHEHSDKGLRPRVQPEKLVRARPTRPAHTKMHFSTIQMASENTAMSCRVPRCAYA